MKTPAIRKPRNPFAVAASRRRAGSHRPGNGALRQRARAAMRRELETMTHSP
ncbi:MAG: hypothetical protein QM702_15925 [Rubrivivax sp.]